MESTCYFLFVCCAILLPTCFFFLFIHKTKPKTGIKNLPPGPARWPIIGNMLELGSMPHQTVHNLRPKYGSVIWLKLGLLNTMVVQSAKAAEQLFKHNDLQFCDRKVPDSLTAHDYYKGSMVFGRYGAYWRLIRRLCMTEVMVNKRVNDTADLRRKCVDNMIKFIEEDSNGEKRVIILPKYLFLMSFNLVGNLVLSRDLLDSKSETGNVFFEAMDKLMTLVGKPNLADFFPFLRWLDPMGIRRNMKKDMGKVLKIATSFVMERIEERKLEKQRSNMDLLDVLLDYDGDGKEGIDKISDHNLRVLVLEMFLAGSETTSTVLEWTMTELLRNPETMNKAKEELSRVIGSKKKVEENNIDDLPYLQAIVKESLRLHPPAPLLIPRNTIEDTEFMGYRVPKDTQVLVNVWAIGRDLESWDDPLAFKPERFMGSSIDYKGQNFELLPFGAGRRVCVGMSLAHRVLHLVLASLLHHFDWEIGSNVKPEDLDMREKFGITLRKLVPLEVIPKKRFI